MGLSSSQARLLTLTSRQHSVEYAAQRIEAQKLQLANESDKVYNDYLQKLDATKVQYKVVENDGSIRFDDASFSKLKEAGFIFDVGGTVCSNYEQVKTALNNNYGIDISVDDSYTVLSTLVSEGYVVLMQQKDDPEAGYSYDFNGSVVYTDPYDESNSDSWHVEDPDNKVEVYKVFADTSVSTSTKVQEISDEVGLKKAEAQYEADMSRINAKDSRYDTELSQLETERNAIKLEIDTLKNVAKDNVDRTFKIFS